MHNLPPMTLVRQRTLRTLAVRIGIPMATVVAFLVVAGIRSHNGAMVSGGAIAIGLIVLIIAIEVPIILASQERARRRLLASAPEGTMFAAQATPMPNDRTFSRGVLTIEESGMTLSRLSKGGSVSETVLPWNEISHLSVKPATRGLRGVIEAQSSYGQGIVVSCTGTNRLIEILETMARGTEPTARVE